MIFITGLPRSGTSVTCRALQALGVDFGTERSLAKPTKHNPTGFMENLAVRQDTVKPILETLGADPKGQGPLPPRRLQIEQWDTDAVRDRVLEQLEEAEAYKDAKLVLLWSLWVAAFPEARWVIVRRDREAVVRSCLRTSFMRRFETEADWNEWADEYEARRDDLSGSVDHVSVEPGPDPDCFRPLADFLGAQWTDKAARVFRKEAWHV